MARAVLRSAEDDIQAAHESPITAETAPHPAETSQAAAPKSGDQIDGVVKGLLTAMESDRKHDTEKVGDKFVAKVDSVTPRARGREGNTLVVPQSEGQQKLPRARAGERETMLN